MPPIFSAGRGRDQARTAWGRQDVWYMPPPAPGNHLRLHRASRQLLPALNGPLCRLAPAELQQAIGSPLALVRAGAAQELAGMLRSRGHGEGTGCQAGPRLIEDDDRAVTAAAIAALSEARPAASSPATADAVPPLRQSAQAPTGMPAGRPPGAGRAIRPWLALTYAALGIAVTGLVTVIIVMSGTPTAPTTPAVPGTPPAVPGTPPAVPGTPPAVPGTPAASGTPTVRWTYTTGDSVLFRPAVAGRTLNAGNADGKMYALDAASGHPRWAYNTSGFADSAPAVTGGTVYIGSADDNVYALNARS